MNIHFFFLTRLKKINESRGGHPNMCVCVQSCLHLERSNIIHIYYYFFFFEGEDYTQILDLIKFKRTKMVRSNSNNKKNCFLLF